MNRVLFALLLTCASACRKNDDAPAVRPESPRGGAIPERAPAAPNPEMERLRAQLEQTNQRLAAAEQRVQVLEQRVNQQDQVNAQQSQQIQQLGQRLQQLQARLRRARAKLRQIIADQNASPDDVRAFAGEAAGLPNDLPSPAETPAAYSSEVDGIRSDLAAATVGLVAGTVTGALDPAGR